MLALALTNAVGVLLFGVLYAVAGARLMPQPAFVVCLLLIFALVTALWVRVEARHRGLEMLRRLGRVAGALVLVVVAAPVAVLMPAFWFDSQLPAEAGITRYLAPLMSLVLISLVLVAAVNVVGAGVAVARGIGGWRRAARAGER
jgi:hypothetical protein